MSDKEIPQLASEIRTLAHRGWEHLPDTEVLFRAIGERAQKISELAVECTAPAPQCSMCVTGRSENGTEVREVEWTHIRGSYSWRHPLVADRLMSIECTCPGFEEWANSRKNGGTVSLRNAFSAGIAWQAKQKCTAPAPQPLKCSAAEIELLLQGLGRLRFTGSSKSIVERLQDNLKASLTLAPTPQVTPTLTRFNEFDDDEHPFRQWWVKHGHFMLSGGGRRESIWAARGWIAREQLACGAEVTGDSMHERGTSEQAPQVTPSWKIDGKFSTEPQNPWKEVIADACCAICTDFYPDDPQKSLTSLIHWQVQTALDPRVSEAAAKLLAATPQVTPTWGWIVKQIHSHTPILDCPQCHATSERTAQTRCTGNEDNCPMDSGRNWLETILKLNIETIAAGFYGDPASEVTPCDHFWRTVAVNPRWSWFTECEKCKIGAPLELQAENYVEGTSEQASPNLEHLEEKCGTYGCPKCVQVSESRQGNGLPMDEVSEQASPMPDKCPKCNSADRSGHITAWAGLEAVYCDDSWHSSAATPKGTK